MAQKIYLSNYELKEAVALYINKLKPLNIKREIVKTWEAHNKITAVPVFSKMSSPFYNSSAMDGITLKASSTIGASGRSHIILHENEDYIVVDTGDPIPKKYDCVIMIEDLIKIDDSTVEIYKSITPWQNIRPLGEDIVEAQLIISSNQKIRPVDIGAMIAGGVNDVEVYASPNVGIIPTGTEMVEPGTKLKIGDIIEFNSRIFSAQISEWGGNPHRYDIADDDYEKLKSVVKTAVIENDIVLINAGSSAGREDFTKEIIEELGEVFIHGISIKPGKPVILGKIDGKPVIGIPGFPVSAYIIMEKIVKQLVLSLQEITYKQNKTIDAILSRRIMSSLKYLEFIRVKLGLVGDKLVVTPLTRGAGATMSLVRADGMLQIPQSVEGIEAGSVVKVELLKDEAEINNTLICIGSHDPIIDIISDMIHLRPKQYNLSSAHVGSMGGIMALKNEETHISPIHLLDTQTGEYNVSYLNKYLKDKDILLIKCVRRIQGLMVAKGNPLNIKSFSDIKENSLIFVNRQRGSGTRLLLDYNLKKLNINPSDIIGYEREEFTHLSVAAAVAAHDADCGLGVYSASQIMGLDFIPLCSEEYDIAVPKKYIQDDMIKEFIEVLKSSEFKKELDRLGGYDYSNIGTII